jgi:hypothetical protein
VNAVRNSATPKLARRVVIRRGSEPRPDRSGIPARSRRYRVSIPEGFDDRLFILDEEGRVAVSLYDRVVDRDDLLALSGLIEERNDRAQAFFASFDASGAA